MGGSGVNITNIRKLIGLMMIITLPLLSIVHLIAMLSLIPFVAIYAALHQFVKCSKELLDLRNTGSFAKGILERAYKLITGAIK